MAESGKKSFPTWAKWLIAAGVILFMAICGLFYAGSILFKNVTDKIADPVSTEHVADSVATFSKPLPAGFKFEASTEMFNMKTLIVSHRPERMTIAITVVGVKSNDAVGKGFQSGFEAGLKSSSSGSFEQTGEGKLPIADRKLDYKVGYQQSRTGKVPILRGQILDVPEKLISILVYSEKGKPFDLKLFQKFLNSIEDLSPGP